jgi:hypothetical protein
MKKTCPRCNKRVSERVHRCRACGYKFPEGAGPRPAGLAYGAGFPLFLMGTLILFVEDIPIGLVLLGVGMVIIGLGLFFDPR